MLRGVPHGCQRGVPTTRAPPLTRSVAQAIVAATTTSTWSMVAAAVCAGFPGSD